MCGICGIFNDNKNMSIDRGVLTVMNNTMVHRGPDDEGYYVDKSIGLAMRRLSIIDLVTGQQPMMSDDGNVVAVCNGEIYNFKEIKKDLQSLGCKFKTNADAEVIPYLYQEYGDEFINRMNGMFGVAVWDKVNRRLVIARDRMGQKPLYYSHHQGVFTFASELKALMAHSLVQKRIDRLALAKYLAYEYVPAPATIFEGVHKVGPGEMLIVQNGNVTKHRYWDVPLDEFSHIHSEKDITEELSMLLKKSVERRLISDVPLGVFLSGGIDSSTIVAMMSQIRNPKSIKTFSIAFSEKSFDESSYARKVAYHFGTDHREKTLRPDDLVSLLPEVSSFLDEPMADNSIIPTYALSKFTREHVTVALGGDGGDELFAGYQPFQADKYARAYRILPKVLRENVLETLASYIPVSDENISFDFKVKQFLKGAGISEPKRHMIWMGAFSPDEQLALWNDMPTPSVFDDVESYWRRCHGTSYGNRVLYLYKKLYLQEDILVKVDRASMATSLEVRAPFLDPDVVEFVSRLPYSYKLRGMNMKYILKKTVQNMLPKGIAKRHKKGFGVPVAKWFKKELKELLCDELAEDKIKREGYFRPSIIAKYVDEHLRGKADHRKKLWTLLIFELWLNTWAR